MTLEEKIAQLEQENAELRRILGAVQSVHEDDKKGLLRNIGRDLRSEFRDFYRSVDDAMDCELGEIYRGKFHNVYKLLTRNGIEIDLGSVVPHIN